MRAHRKRQPLPRDTWRRLVLVVSTLAFGVGTGRACAADEITWALNDRPPIFLDQHLPGRATVGQLGDGIGDTFVRVFVAQLPDYQHRFEVLSDARIWGQIRAGKHVCYCAALKSPERLEFSYMTAISPNVGVSAVALRGRLDDYLQPGAALDLAALAGDASLHGVVAPPRRFGASIDRTLAAPRSVGVTRASLPESPQLVQMLAAGHIDYVLEYSFTIQYYLTQVPDPPDLQYYPLALGHDEVITYAACPRSAWGRRVIDRLDAVMRNASGLGAIRTALSRWLPAAVREREQPRFDRYYDERATRSDVQ